MLVDERVLHGAERLSERERQFLLLIGLYANDLGVLRKLLMASFREPPDKLEQKANGVLVGVLMRLLCARLWQGWELLRSVLQKQVLAEATWLHKNTKLHTQIRKLKPHFPDDCVWERIRNQFAYHYDPSALSQVADLVIPDIGFELVGSEQVHNTFFVSSEFVEWYSILRVTDEHAFAQAFEDLVNRSADRAGDFLGIIREIVTAFRNHVVNDLGGSFPAPTATSDIQEVPCASARLPLFAT